MDKLQPCPFCGGETRARIGVGTLTYFYCQNPECGAITSFTGKRKIQPNVFESDNPVGNFNRRAALENKPLTLDQLRQMDGDPVWIQRGKKGTYRVVKDVSYGGTYGGEVRFTDSGPTGLRVEDYCKTWVPYARKPEQEDNQ